MGVKKQMPLVYVAAHQALVRGLHVQYQPAESNKMVVEIQ